MKKLPLMVVVTLVVAFAPTSFAGEKKKKTPEHHDTVIASVSSNSVVVTADKTTKTFPITQFTEITLKGQRATINDLAPGMAVSVTLGVDGVSASRINASDPPVHNDPPPKKKTKVPAGFMK